MRKSGIVIPANAEATFPTPPVKAGRGTLVRSAIACLIGTFILRMAAAVMGNMIHLYFAKIDRELFPISFTMSSAINAVFFLPELFGSPILGALSDKYGRKLFIMLGPLTGAIAVQITAFTSFLPLLAVTRFLEGLSTASAIPATLSYLSAITSQDDALRARVMGLFEIATFGGTVAGVLLGGPLFDAFQNHAFTLNGLIYLVSLAILYFGMFEVGQPDPAHHVPWNESFGQTWRIARDASSHALNGIRSALTIGHVWRFAPAWLAINMLPGLWLNNLTRQLVSRRPDFPDQMIFGLLSHTPHPGAQISFGGGVVLGLFAVGVVLWTLIVNRFRRTSLMLFCASGLPVVVVALYFLNHSGGPNAPYNRVYLVIAGLALMVVSGFTPAALTYLADLTEHSPVNRGAIMGLYTVLFGLGQFTGEFLGGPFGDWRGVDGLLTLTLILGVVAVGTVLWMRRADKPRGV